MVALVFGLERKITGLRVLFGAECADLLCKLLRAGKAEPNLAAATFEQHVEALYHVAFMTGSSVAPSGATAPTESGGEGDSIGQW